MLVELTQMNITGSLENIYMGSQDNPETPINLVTL